MGGMSTSPITLPCRDVIVKRRRRALLLMAAGLVMMFVGLPFLGVALSWIGVLAAVGSAIWLFIQAARTASMRRVGGTLTLEAETLHLVDVHGVVEEIRIADVESGYEARSGTAVLRLNDGAEVWIRIAPSGAGGAHHVIEHALVGPSHRAMTMGLRRMLGALTIGVLTFAGAGWGALILASWLPVEDSGYRILGAIALALLTTAVVVVRLGFPRVVVGSDGIRILGVLRPRFIAHDAIKGAKAVIAGRHGDLSHVRVDLRDGSNVVLPAVVADPGEVEGLARRIDETGRAADVGRARHIAALARGDRSLRDWRKDVTRVAVAEPGFRQNAIASDDFDRVLRDAAAPIDQRVGAALALRVIDPDNATARIRVAAETSADDVARQALSAAGEADVDEVMLDTLTKRRA